MRRPVENGRVDFRVNDESHDFCRLNNLARVHIYSLGTEAEHSAGYFQIVRMQSLEPFYLGIYVWM